MRHRPRLTYAEPMSKPMTRRRTAAQRAKLVQQWEASGQSAAAFADGRGFSGASLYSWRSRLGGQRRPPEADDPPPGSGVDFVPVVFEAESEDARATGATSWELTTAAGLSISMAGPDALRGLEVALRALRGEVAR